MAEAHVYTFSHFLTRPIILVWNSLFVEWLAIQILSLYSIFRLYNTVNYLKQVLAMMWFVISVCLYLSLWQLELFACFLFLGEFTILIFFYCLLLHLKASISQNNSSNNTIGLQQTIIVIIALAILWLLNKGFIVNFFENSIAYAIDLYNNCSDFLLNDLAALLFYFTSANIILHAVIGIILFLLTLFLFTTITLYVSSTLMRKSIFKGTYNKLFVTRGYYEQNAYTTQKFFSQTPRDNK